MRLATMRLVVTVFQGNTCCRNGNYLFRRNIHEIKVWWVLWLSPWWRPITISSANVPSSTNLELACEITVYFIFFHQSHPNYLSWNIFTVARSTYWYGVWMKPYLLRCPYEDALLIKPMLGPQVFQLTHTTVVCIVHVTNFISGTVTCQTTRSQGWRTTFVWQILTMGCVGPWTVTTVATEEFFWAAAVTGRILMICCVKILVILNWHTPYASVIRAKTNTELVSATNGTDTTVTKVVDIVYSYHIPSARLRK